MNIIDQRCYSHDELKIMLHTMVLKFVQSIDIVPVWLGINVQLVKWQSHRNTSNSLSKVQSNVHKLLQLGVSTISIDHLSIHKVRDAYRERESEDTVLLLCASNRQ